MHIFNILLHIYIFNILSYLMTWGIKC